jgi:hypothetical protein
MEKFAAFGVDPVGLASFERPGGTNGGATDVQSSILAF